MPQKSFSTTTSFIVSSDESLNKRSLSSSQSTDSGSDNMTAITNDSARNNDYSTANPVNNITFNQSSLSSMSSNSYSSGQMIYPTQTAPSTMMVQMSTTNGKQPNHSGSSTNSFCYNSFTEQYNNNSNFTDNCAEQNPNSDKLSSNELSQTNDSSSEGSQGHSFYPKPTNNISKKSNFLPKPFQQQLCSNQSTSSNNFHANSDSLMPINIKAMILNGVASDEVLRSWLKSIRCEEYLQNFIDHGYDIHLLTRMTPQDLTAVGCRSPSLRKKLLLEIKKLNLEDDIPNRIFNNLAQWLSALKLNQYYRQLYHEGYDSIDKVSMLTWEDLEDIGIIKLGHQKRLLLGIERYRKIVERSENLQKDQAIYDVHPNHRISLKPGIYDRRTLRSNIRSGFFQTKSGNLDIRGLPVATVVPALKHVNNSLVGLDISQQTIANSDTKNGNNICTVENDRLTSENILVQEHAIKLSEFTGTIKRPPPLPPIRTNSLKFPQDLNQFDNNIYDNTQGNNNITSYSTTSSTSFLRTPKLGTLTATTNKMLSHGGHIQTISSHVPMMKSTPIREAPPPPPQMSNHVRLSIRVEEEPSLGSSSDSFINTALIGHQIASADEFPPPPPPQ